MTHHPVPAEALTKHIAILGKTGSGKSNLAKTIAEQLLLAGERVCVIDPTGTWWGLRLDADGVEASDYPIVIFGGQHADLPLAAAHGEIIARAIGTSSTPALIDTRQLTVADRTRFFTGFAETLIRTNQGELTLIIDEAHLFMPQSGARVGGAAPAMLHAGNNLVSLGRGVGLRIILISQRPAKLHKDSLTQVETLVAMRLLAPQDRKAIGEWIDEWAAGSDAEGLTASLPSLPTGQAWIWSPEINHLERAHCPLAGTYDSGSVREQDNPDLPPIDVGEIAERLEDIGSDLLADDPRRLRKRIAELERELRKKPSPAADEAEIERRVAAAVSTIHHGYDRHTSASGAALLAISRDLRTLAGKLDEARGALVSEGPPPPPKPAVPRAAAPAARAPAASAGLTKPQQRVLDALAWLGQHSLGTRAGRVQVAFLAGYKPGGGAFNNTLGACRTAGLIEYPSSGEVALTEAGRALAHVPDAPLTTEEMHEAVLKKLSRPQQRVLAPLLEIYPQGMDAVALATAAGYEAAGGAFANYRGSLRTLGLVEYPQRGRVRACDALFM